MPLGFIDGQETAYNNRVKEIFRKFQKNYEGLSHPDADLK